MPWAAAGARLQEGIFHSDRVCPRAHFGVIFLRASHGVSGAQVRETLGALWQMWSGLKRGESPELPGVKLPQENLAVTLGYGPRAFCLDGMVCGTPGELAPSFLFRSPMPAGGGLVLPGSGLRYAPDVRVNLATEDFAVQFFADSPLAIERAIVESWALLHGHVDESTGVAPLQITSHFTGHTREDGRSWLGFHDGISNLQPGEERLRAIVIKPTNRAEDAWTVGGSYFAFFRFAIDIESWRALDRKTQELIVGRDKLSGAAITSLDAAGNPVTASGCPMHAAREVLPSTATAADEPPDVSEEVLRQSHAQRANHHRRDIENRDSLRIFRQSFEALESIDTPPRFRAALNFTCYQDTPERLVRLLTQPGWMGRTNFGGDPDAPHPGMAALVTTRAAGIYLVPPCADGEAFPGSVAFPSA
jgi:Dyp-type peroxidase family